MSTRPGWQLSLREQAQQAEDRLRAIAELLAADGMDSSVAIDGGLPCLRAWAPGARQRCEIVVDEEGYADVAWNTSADDPARAASTISQILTAITARSAI